MQGFYAAHGTFFFHPFLACCLIYMYGRDCRGELRVRSTGYGILLVLPSMQYCCGTRIFPPKITQLERGLGGLDSYRTVLVERRLERRCWGCCHLSSDAPR